VILLRSDELLVRVDPARGGEILDLVDLSSGRQLLGRPPFGSDAPRGGDLDEATWTRDYRGGWQTVLPNAGNACDVAGARHGFHGCASTDPWVESQTTASSTTLCWSRHGLDVQKRIALRDGAIAIGYRIANAADGPVPLVALEHVSIGLEILYPAVHIAFPPAGAYELSERDGPLEAGGSRLYVLRGLAEGWAAVWADVRGQGLALAWDVSWFAHCRVWHENRGSPEPWRRQGEILTIEPSTVPHSLGLAVAEHACQARVLEPGQIAEPWIVARPFIAIGEVRGVGRDGVVAY
jgi:hypothetical protein